ncbi:MAG: hypothetical protein ACTIJ6_06265 [Leucobacter sp.]
MSSGDPHNTPDPQSPRAAPAPQWQQPVQQQQQWQPALPQAAQQQQWQQPAQYAPNGTMPQPGFTPRPTAKLNVQAVAAFIITAFVAVVVSFVYPFIMRSMSEFMASAGYSPVAYTLWAWLPAFLIVPLLIAAAVLAFVGLQPKRPSRGRFLAYIALGGAAFGIIDTIFSMLGSRFAYLF